MTTQADYERTYHALYRQCGGDVNQFIANLARAAAFRQAALVGLTGAVQALEEFERGLLAQPADDDGTARQRMGFGTSGDRSQLVPVENTKANGPVEYTIIFDGGARGNPGPGYGSWIVEEEGFAWPVRRREYGVCTNNEAEYGTLIAALKELVHDVGIGPEDTLLIKGDSKLVLYQVGVDPATRKPWKANEPRMRALRDEALDLLTNFKGFRVEWWPREHSVAVLGH